MESNKPLISVIIPVRNGQDYLENCIRSIEAQTYDRIEILIIDNGSEDRTGEVCGEIAAAYGNVRLLALEKAGVSAARNAGIDAAAGELITFVDADDRLCPDMLRVLYDGITGTNSDVAGCSFFEWSSEAEWAARDRGAPTADNAGYTIYDAKNYLKDAVLCGNSRCWSKLYRREMLDRARFPEDLAIGEDMLFLVRLLAGADRIAETKWAGYGYFQNPAGAMFRKFTPDYMDQITCWQLAREEVLRMDRGLDAQVTALYMMGIMLTAGKIAVLPAAERREQSAYVEICHERLREAMRVPGARGRLSAGYRLKTALFSLCPGLYMVLYRAQKAFHLRVKLAKRVSTR